MILPREKDEKIIFALYFAFYPNVDKMSICWIFWNRTILNLDLYAKIYSELIQTAIKELPLAYMI